MSRSFRAIAVACRKDVIKRCRSSSSSNPPPRPRRSTSTSARNTKSAPRSGTCATCRSPRWAWTSSTISRRTTSSSPTARKILTELKKLAKDADEVFLATDLDREGEAIAWHLASALKLPSEKTRRVVFNEITQNAIREAFQHPSAVDENKVNAQQARRILDRIVGYQLSPLLWAKVRRGLSAGRVQSVVVRLIVEREREIEKFKPQEYWEIAADLAPLKPHRRRAGEIPRAVDEARRQAHRRRGHRSRAARNGRRSPSPPRRRRRSLPTNSAPRSSS